MAMARLHLDLLGGFDCRSSAATAHRVAVAAEPGACSPTSQCRPGGLQAREQLAGLLWGDRSDDRREPTCARRCRGCARLCPTMVAISSSSIRATQRSGPTPSRSIPCASSGWPRTGRPKALERAAILYRGELMAGLARCGEEFDAWLRPERRRLEELHHDVLRRLLDHYVGHWRRSSAPSRWRCGCCGLDPLQESVHRTLMRLYMYQDRVGAALGQYGHCREVLARELGVGPAPDTERLRAELLRLLPEGAGEQPAARASTRCPSGTMWCGPREQRARRRAELAGRPSLVVLSLAGAECDAALTASRATAWPRTSRRSSLVSASFSSSHRRAPSPTAGQGWHPSGSAASSGPPMSSTAASGRGRAAFG